MVREWVRWSVWKGDKKWGGKSGVRGKWSDKSAVRENGVTEEWEWGGRTGLRGMEVWWWYQIMKQIKFYNWLLNSPLFLQLRYTDAKTIAFDIWHWHLNKKKKRVIFYTYNKERVCQVWQSYIKIKVPARSGHIDRRTKKAITCTSTTVLSLLFQNYIKFWTVKFHFTCE